MDGLFNLRSSVLFTERKERLIRKKNLFKKEYLQFLSLVNGFKWTKNPENTQNFDCLFRTWVNRAFLIPVDHKSSRNMYNTKNYVKPNNSKPSF